MKINPIKLIGEWTEGYSLDIHTTNSVYIGENSFGNPQFDTTYSEIGECLKRLKYRDEYCKANKLAEVTTNFVVNDWKISKNIDLIIPVPPSKKREFQPVFLIVEELSKILKKNYCLDYFEKKDNREVKNLTQEEKDKILSSDILIKNKTLVKPVNVLLIDDLYDSGFTLKLVCKELLKDKKIKNIYVLTMTKTRKG